ncbi:MAG: hypothetical protein QM640_04440 [Niabella sp.]
MQDLFNGNHFGINYDVGGGGSSGGGGGSQPGGGKGKTNPGDPGAKTLPTVKAKPAKPQKQQTTDILNKLGTILSALGVSYDLTKLSSDELQRIANLLYSTKNEIIDIGKLRLIKGVTTNTAGKLLGGIGLVITGVDITFKWFKLE